VTQFSLDKVKDLLGTENIPGSPEELEVLTQWTQGLAHQKGEQYVRKCRKRLYKDWESIRRPGLSRIWEKHTAWKLRYCGLSFWVVSVHPKMAIFRNLYVRLIRRRRTRNTQCIPPVKIFVFLDLAKNISFSDGH
jgi:hypothetical protein